MAEAASQLFARCRIPLGAGRPNVPYGLWALDRLPRTARIGLLTAAIRYTTPTLTALRHPSRASRPWAGQTAARGRRTGPRPVSVQQRWLLQRLRARGLRRTAMNRHAPGAATRCLSAVPAMSTTSSPAAVNRTTRSPTRSPVPSGCAPAAAPRAFSTLATTWTCSPAASRTWSPGRGAQRATWSATCPWEPRHRRSAEVSPTAVCTHLFRDHDSKFFFGSITGSQGACWGPPVPPTPSSLAHYVRVVPWSTGASENAVTPTQSPQRGDTSAELPRPSRDGALGHRSGDRGLQAGLVTVRRSTVPEGARCPECSRGVATPRSARCSESA